MKVLVIGSGGREHALCHAIARSGRCERLYCLPGNAGTARIATNVPLRPTDIAAVVDFARGEQIDLTVVGPEDPLAAGLVDALHEAGLRAFGPTAEAARLEADKAFAKTLMKQYAIPTAEARVFTDFRAAKQYIATRDVPLVVKASGLARGKGAIVCDDPADAILAAEKMLVGGCFGEAGRTIVVEERLFGREVSVLAIVEDHTLYVLDPAQDYKRLKDGDEGPNTGGMGAYCPSQVLSPATLRQIEEQILVPTIDALLHEGIRYRGVLYAGLMLTPGGPKVLEFNCRFGDPEAQVILPRIRSDVLELLDAASSGRLEQIEPQWDPRHAVCVVLASEGYPDQPVTGREIRGLEAIEGNDVFVYHAGTKVENGRVVTSGGRVLGVTALGETLEAAREKAYAAVGRIHFDGMQYRRDIGLTECKVQNAK